jgi:hypothetical protein
MKTRKRILRPRKSLASHFRRIFTISRKYRNYWRFVHGDLL